MTKEYRIWIEIEEIDEELDYYESVPGPGGGLALCCTPQKAFEFVDYAEALLSATTNSAVKDLLNCLWDDEFKDFATNPSEDHIFRQLVILNNCLYSENRTAEDHVAEQMID